MQLFQVLRKEWAILLIIAFAFILRIWGLDHQSLWLDELHTVNEADPSIPWRELFHHLKCCDPHPPLYFIAERLFFSAFGHTAFVARIVSVIAGTASIWAMWLLGEILNRNLGRTLAMLTAVNYYNLAYSQEARGYIFAFLFSALSALYLIRLITKQGRKYTFLYALFTLCLLYSHYFSLFVVVAHGVIGMIILAAEQTPGKRIRLFKRLAAAFAIIAIGYLPWIPFLKAVSEIQSFWIEPIPSDFIQTYFSEYFGNTGLLKPLLILLLIVYIIHVSTAGKQALAVKNNPPVLSFILIACIASVSYLVPYVRSLLVVPMLYDRYTIVVLPFILLALAYGIESFNNRLVKNMVLVIFVVCSLVTVLWTRKYYTDIHKTQFREMTEYVAGNNHQNYPVLNEKTSWQQSYYFKKLGSEARQVSGKKNQMADSILHSSSREWSFEGFWLVGAHGDPMLPAEEQAALEEHYMILRQKNFYDAWAQLYVLKSLVQKKFLPFNYNGFSPGEGTILGQQKLLGIWTGYVQTPPFDLAAGNYRITITATGTDLKGEFPHLNVMIGRKKIGSYYLNGEMDERSFDFHIPESGRFKLKIGFDNDAQIEGEGDRNVLLRSVLIEPLK